jgi:hypothetical protein
MQSIGTVGGSGSELMQMLQRLAGQQGTSATGSTRPFGPPSEKMQAEMDRKFEETLKGMGVDDETVSQIQDEIKSAVSETIGSQGKDADGRQAVQDAVDSVLQKHGIDMEEFKSQFKPPTDGMGPPGGVSDLSALSDQSSSSGSLQLSGLRWNTDDISSELLKSLLPLVDEQA